MAEWDRLYDEAIAAGSGRIRSLPGVVVGFHSTIDGLKRVTGEELRRWLDSEPGLTAEVARLLDPEAGHREAPVVSLKEIRTPAELLAALLDCMARGKARQLMIRNEGTFEWALRRIGYDRLRMGGTSGNMANALAPLGLERVLVYAHPLSMQLANLFVDRPNLFVLDRGRLVSPRQAAAENGKTTIRALHWVLEFGREEGFLRPTLSGAEGLAQSPPDQEVEPMPLGRVRWEKSATPRANRFIAAWNPENNRLRVNQEFAAGLLELGELFSHFIVSGFHLLSETYPDGTTYEECLAGVASLLCQLRARHPHLLLHYEFASIASPAIRRGVVEEILPRVDSLGLNEVELVAILHDLGEDELAQGLEAADAEAGKAAAAGQVAAPPVELLLPALARVAEVAGLRRIHLHNLGYYLALVRPKAQERPGTGKAAELLEIARQTREGLLFAAALAAVRATRGEVKDPGEATAALEVPISPVGLHGVNHLTDLVDAGLVETLAGGDVGEGLFSYHEFAGAFVPTRVVAEPLFTVGLGDLISAVAFITGMAG
ncbi:MAG TPA: hypothetical protein GXX55_10815 [Firmicutes bacterium]|nr:hypothetical protein [Bacillota bacterium]